MLHDLRTLRQRCVAAHNRLARDAGHSPIVALLRSLPGLDKPDAKTEGHLLLSSYVFWGSRQLGGSRRGFERRLKQTTLVPYLELHEELKKGRFGAWECVDNEGADRRTTWKLVGPGDDKLQTVTVVGNGNCAPVQPTVGDVRAGWIATVDLKKGLYFSAPISEEAAERLRKATDDRAWHDDELPDGSSLQLIEYERDVLTQTLFPERDDCGLQELYFLPPGLRWRFPDDYRKSVVRTLVRDLGTKRADWHLWLARLDTDQINDEVRPRLPEIRRTAARRAGRFGDSQLPPTVLARLISDQDCLRFLGLEPDGSVDLSRFPPIDGHPLRLLALSDQWFDATGLGQETPVHQARRHIPDETSLQRQLFEQAVDDHRARLRWICLIDRAMSQPDVHANQVRPSYRELRQVCEELFGPIIATMPVSQLLANTEKSTSRIETKLAEALSPNAPLRVLHLPRRRYELGNIPGIGSKSLSLITRALRDTLLGWPPEWSGRAAAPVEEAKKEIDQGLDELDELFG